MSDNYLPPPKRSAAYGRQNEKSKKSGHVSKYKNSIRNSFAYAQGSFDIVFFMTVLALLTIGLVMLFSASYPYAYQNDGDSYFYFKRQLVFALVGVPIMLFVSKLNYKWLKVIRYPLYIVTILLLILVLFYHTDLGREEDFRRWIPLGPITIQPSDIAKFTVVLLMASYISRYHRKMNRLVYGVLIPAVLVGTFCLLIYAENHLSCTVLVFMIGIVMMFCGGTRVEWFIGGICLVAAVAFVVIKNPDILPGYQGDRIRAWIDKGFDPLGLRWQTNNSLYAIGSGGFFGVGLGNSKQKYLYVSEPQNDFIFSIVCEELGFLGAAIIIALFGLLFYRGVKIAQRCEDKFSTMLVIGIVSQIAVQTIFNILVITDLFPNTGIALPFFSYGGTAILMLCFEMGIVLSISRNVNTKKA